MRNRGTGAVGRCGCPAVLGRFGSACCWTTMSIFLPTSSVAELLLTLEINFPRSRTASSSLAWSWVWQCGLNSSDEHGALWQDWFWKALFFCFCWSDVGTYCPKLLSPIWTMTSGVHSHMVDQRVGRFAGAWDITNYDIIMFYLKKGLSL